MIISKVIGVFIIVFVGLGANKIGWLPVGASKYLSAIVIKIAAPCVVIVAMSEQELGSGSLEIILIVICISACQHFFAIPTGMLTNRLMGVQPEHRGIYKNFLIFTNNGFMGFPVALAMFGHDGLFYMVLANSVMNVFIFTIGTTNLKSDNESRLTFWQKVKEFILGMLDAPVIAMIVGFALLIFQVHLPVEITDVLSSIGNVMAPLSMIVIGLQLTESKPKEVISNHRLIIISALRLLILPGIFLGVMLLLRIDPLITCVLTLNAMLPCATVPVVLAEAHGRDSKLAAEGTFLSTLFSMATIPIGGILLTSLL